MRPIVFNGYYVSVHSPSRNLFKTVKVDFSKLSGSDLYKMIEELEETKSKINAEYREREVDTVSESDIRAEFRRARKRRRRVVRFSPYPNRFGNIVNSVRTKLYDLLNLYAIVIPNIEVGAFRRNVYILPKDSIDKFLKEIDILNQRLGELRKAMEEYHNKGYIDKITSILDKYDVKYRVYKASLRNIFTDMFAIVIDPEAISPYISERARKEIEKAKEKIVRQAVKDAEKKIRSMINQYIIMIKKKKFNPKKAKKILEEMKKNVNSLGIVNIDSVIDPLIDMCNDPKKLAEKGLETVSGKVRALLESL